MAQKIAAPAETLRRLAGECSRQIPHYEDKGQRHNAASIRRASTAAYDAAAGQSSNLVAIDARHASTLCAFAAPHEYSDGLRKMLEHQNWW